MATIDNGSSGHDSECADGRRRLPDCIECVPGLFGASCDRLSSKTKALRKSMGKLASQRWGGSRAGLHLYPYLETPAMQSRQALIAALLLSGGAGQHAGPRRILDIGPYVSPILNFLRHCPDEVIAVEPCGELATGRANTPWLSAIRPCPADPQRRLLYTVAPITIREYAALPLAHRYDAVVCAGCDGHLGPSLDFFAKGLHRPVRLFLEHPPERRLSLIHI